MIALLRSPCYGFRIFESLIPTTTTNTVPKMTAILVAEDLDESKRNLINPYPSLSNSAPSSQRASFPKTGPDVVSLHPLSKPTLPSRRFHRTRWDLLVYR